MDVRFIVLVVFNGWLDYAYRDQTKPNHRGQNQSETSNAAEKSNISGYQRSASHEPGTRHGGGKAEGK